MPQLTRRRDKDPHRPGGWFIWYGDVRVGHIGTQAGVPLNLPQWAWSCGFYPGCDPRQQSNGTAGTFEEARAGFEVAWNRLLPTLTEAHFELWRHDRDWTAWKNRMWDASCRLPTQNTNGISRCFCGAEITNSTIGRHIRETHRGIGVA
ncbi:hypothetical protein [Bradyrhizobium sp. SZCCHNRI2010]|uniref:hypothetical protein n=1 Tax=Bradyrhizobium sp. SZCCHNRI2010 TaxID=3057283 RepID=UPI0028E762F7|nr:hypothetical protein [Bradyrhizobium sp. SZCCHNRI2010]